MFELHSWIVIRETYKVTDDEEENIHSIVKNIQNEISKLKWNNPKLKVLNGQYYLEYTIFSNRETYETKELFTFFEFVVKVAIGSYGLIYVRNGGDNNGKSNEFQVYSIFRGSLHLQKDTFLSPFIPTVEDQWYY